MSLMVNSDLKLKNLEKLISKGQKMKPVPKGKKGKGLSKLPKKVRNKMGFMKNGGRVKKGKK